MPDDGIPSAGAGQGGSGGAGGSNSSGSEAGFGSNLPIAGSGGSSQTGAGSASMGGSSAAGGSGSSPFDAGVEPVDAGEPPFTCPGLTFEASCYEFVAAPVVWDVAETACAERDAHLVKVETIEEDTFLAGWPQVLGVPANNGAGIWLGATDAQLENDFRWPDGTPLIFARWGTLQPDNGAGVDCVEKRNEVGAQWYDQRCTDVKAYICEREL